MDVLREILEEMHVDIDGWVQIMDSLFQPEKSHDIPGGLSGPDPYIGEPMDVDSDVGFKPQPFSNPEVYPKSATRKNNAFLFGKEYGAR